MLTGRLVTLRPIEAGDLDLLTDLANDLTVRGSVVGWDLPVAKGGQEAWLESSRGSNQTIRLAVVNRADQSTIGMTGLWDMDSRPAGSDSGQIDAGVEPQGGRN